MREQNSIQDAFLRVPKLSIKTNARLSLVSTKTKPGLTLPKAFGPIIKVLGS